MKFKNIKYALLGLIALSLAACETMDDYQTEFSPVYPVAGEWQTHVADENGVNVVATSGANPTGIISLRTYNTADNNIDKAWIRLGTTQVFAIWGKATCDIPQKTLSGQTIINDAKTGGAAFTILEGKVLVAAQKVSGGAMADSIFVKYTSTSAPGKTYTVKGHRRTRWDPLE